MLGASSGDGLLDLGPLSDEVNQRLRLNGRSAPEFDGISAELDCPFDDAAAGFLIVENVTERVLRDYHYVVGIEVVVELPGCD